MRARVPWRRGLLAVSATLITLAATELALRLFHPVQFMAPPPEVAEDAWRALLHRRSEVPGLR